MKQLTDEMILKAMRNGMIGGVILGSISFVIGMILCIRLIRKLRQEDRKGLPFFASEKGSIQERDPYILSFFFGKTECIRRYLFKISGRQQDYCCS